VELSTGKVTLFPSLISGETILPCLKPVFCCAFAPILIIAVSRMASSFLSINFLEIEKLFGVGKTLVLLDLVLVVGSCGGIAI
jgi:hypothetical protein